MDDGPSLQAPCPEEVVVIPPKTPTPQPPPRPTPVQPKIASLAELPSDFVGMMCGRLDSPAYIEDKIIYIYHCSNFSGVCIELYDDSEPNGVYLAIVLCSMVFPARFSEGEKCLAIVCLSQAERILCQVRL